MSKWKQHLDDTGWTYWQHLHHSVTVGNELISIALRGYLHGLFPNIWANVAPVRIYRIFKSIRSLRHTQKLFDAEDQREVTK